MVRWFSEAQEKATSKIFDLLSYCELTYWVESGSLLLATRDEYIPKKEDFDIGALFDEEKIKKLEAQLRDLDASFQLSTYNGDVYKVKIKFVNCIPIDIIFYESYNDTLLSPQKYYSSFHRKYLSSLLYAKRILFKQDANNNAQMENFVLDNNSIFYRVGTWTIPKKLIGNINISNKSGFRVPENLNDYLTYRYGNWMIPNKNLWIFHIHDGGFSKLDIETIKQVSSNPLNKKIFNES